MARYEITEAASQDLEDIFVFGITRFGETQAMRLRDAFLDHFRELSEMPKIAQVAPIGDGKYRRSTLKSFAIYYRELGWGILVVRILGRQDARLALGEDD